MINTINKFIIGIKEHAQLAYIPVALEVTQTNDEFYKIERTIVFQDVMNYSDTFTQLEKELVSIIDNYSDQKIYSFFNKNKKLSITEYFAQLDKKMIDDYIRPHVERNVAHLFEILKNHPEIEIYYKNQRYDNIYINDKCNISQEKAKAIFNFERSDSGIKYWLTIWHNNHEIKIYHKKPIILLNQPALIELEHNFMFVDKIDAKKLLPFYDTEFISVQKSMEMTYFKNFILKTVRDFDVKAYGFKIIEASSNKKAILFIETDWLGEYAIIPKFKYGEKIFKFNDKITNFIEFDEKTFSITKYSRDCNWELKIFNKLIDLGLAQTNENIFKVPFSTKDKDTQHNNTITWLNENHEKVITENFEIVQNFSSKKYHLQEVSISFNIENKIDWFDLNATVTFGEFEIPFYKLKEYIINNIHEYELPNGQIAIIPDTWFRKYSQLLKFAKKTAKNTLKISKFHFTALQSAELDEINKEFKTDGIDEFFRNPFKNTFNLPKGLKSELRSYQQVGYSWLIHLNKNSFGGCLADDMGLGKTIQVLSAIQKLVEERKELDTDVKMHNLVIVPRSLLHNWLNEIHKHTSLKALLYTGNEREKLQHSFGNFDIIVSSYGIARNDVTFLQNFNFNYVILDESQYIKNSSSKTYQALKLIQSQNKIVLTGTPIENSLFDLWSQMNFINPGLLGSAVFFKENFVVPIEKHKNEIIKNELKQLIAPFILRRTKQEVEEDLPDIDIQTVTCEMTDEQAELYDSEKSRIRNKIIELYERNDINKSSFYILQALTRLRQLSNHPAMIFDDYNHSSGKFDEIIDRIETLIAENHKVLIFSNFVKYLNIFAKTFKERNWSYKILTGQSQNRQQIVDDFQEDKDTKLFLISIKAGGYGLNITAADYVFILDPWWNPAVEMQAISRAHRIGQTRKVFAYRFITYGTVEEKIQHLQQKKIELSSEFIDANNYFKYFEEEEVVELFH